MAYKIRRNSGILLDCKTDYIIQEYVEMRLETLQCHNISVSEILGMIVCKLFENGLISLNDIKQLLMDGNIELIRE